MSDSTQGSMFEEATGTYIGELLEDMIDTVSRTHKMYCDVYIPQFFAKDKAHPLTYVPLWAMSLPLKKGDKVKIINTGNGSSDGKSGKAYTFCSEQDVYNLPAIERYVGYAIPATMAAPEMMLDDASAGMYIKTDRYDADFDSNRGNHKNNRDRGNYQGKGRYGEKSGYKSGENRGNGEYHGKGKNA